MKDPNEKLDAAFEKIMRGNYAVPALVLAKRIYPMKHDKHLPFPPKD